MKSSSTPSSRRRRPLNSLETFFVSYNVRFALLLVVMFEGKETTTCSKDVVVERISTAQIALDSSRLGHLCIILSNNSDDDNEKKCWSLVETEKNVNNKVVVRQLPETTKKELEYGEFLDDIVEQATIPAEGPLSIQIFDDTSSSRQTTMLYINGNHAMVDGRSLTHLLGFATGMYESTLEWKGITLPDWKDMVEESIASLPKWIAEPPFLHGEHNNLLTLNDLSSIKTSKSESFRDSFSGESVTALRLVLKKKCPAGSTISSFLASLLMHAVAEEYHDKEPKDVGVSMLVDLRPYFQQRDDGQGEQEIPQAHGTVTLLESTQNLKKKTTNLLSNILDVSIRMTEQMRHRISRGEAHRSALAVTNGYFDERAGPKATMELSNLGVCLIPDGTQLYTAQRFDGYDGISFMVHSEGNSGRCMRWNMSVGEGLDATLMKRIFTRAMDLFEEVAKL